MSKTMKKAGAKSTRASVTLIAVSGMDDEMANFIEYYDPDADEWKVLPNFTFDRRMFSSILFDGKLVIVGGEKGGHWVTDVDTYDFETGQFGKLPPISASIYDCTLVVQGGYLYIIGGVLTERAPLELSIVERFNPAANEWEILPDIPITRRKPEAVAYNDEIFIIGGDHEGLSLSDVVAFNSTTNTWRTCASMNENRAGVSAEVFGDYIYAFSGHNRIMTSAGDDETPPTFEVTYFKSTERYDPVANSWTRLEDSNWIRTYSEACLFDDSIVIAGGQSAYEDELSVYTDVVEKYDPVENKFNAIASLTQPRIFFDLIVVPFDLAKKSLALKNKK